MTAQYDFGSGILRAVRTDITGLTPLDFGTLQDVSFDFSVDLKPLYGRWGYPIAMGAGKRKVEAKAKVARVQGNLYNNIYFGTSATTQTVAQRKMAENEIDTPSAGSVTVANAANFLADLGVYYQSTNTPLTKTTSTSPATAGTYYASLSGIYKVNAADNGKPLLITYLYSAATGVQLAIGNPQMGPAPVFQAVFAGDTPLGGQVTFTFNQVMCSKLNFASKQDDWTIPEFDMEIFADASNNIGYASFSE